MLLLDFLKLSISCLFNFHHFFLERLQELGPQQIWKALIELMSLGCLVVGFLKFICEIISLLIKYRYFWSMSLLKLFNLGLECLHLKLTLVIHVFHLASHLVARWLGGRNRRWLAVAESKGCQPIEDLGNLIEAWVLQPSLLIFLEVKSHQLVYRSVQLRNFLQTQIVVRSVLHQGLQLTSNLD